MHSESKNLSRFALGLSVALLPLMVWGASDEFVFYDLAKCEVFRVSNEPAQDRAYQRMLEGAEGEGWGLYEYSGPSGGGRGLCKWSGPAYKERFAKQFVCNQTSRSNFPLVGATYSVIPDKGDIPSYRCTKGCRKDTPGVLHYLGEEPDSPVSPEHGKTREKFEKKCGAGQ